MDEDESMYSHLVKRRAEEEIEEEDFKARVLAEKTRIRAYKPLWDRIFPWKIVRK